MLDKLLDEWSFIRTCGDALLHGCLVCAGAQESSGSPALTRQLWVQACTHMNDEAHRSQVGCRQEHKWKECPNASRTARSGINILPHGAHSFRLTGHYQAICVPQIWVEGPGDFTSIISISRGNNGMCGCLMNLLEEEMHLVIPRLSRKLRWNFLTKGEMSTHSSHALWTLTEVLQTHITTCGKTLEVSLALC